MQQRKGIPKRYALTASNEHTAISIKKLKEREENTKKI